MDSDRLDRKLRLRRKIQLAGHDFYESIEDKDLQYLAGELFGKNEWWALEFPNTVGTEIILKQGFTTKNQKKFIENLRKKLKKIKEE